MITYGYLYEKIGNIPLFSFSCKKKGKNGPFLEFFPPKRKVTSSLSCMSFT